MNTDIRELVSEAERAMRSSDWAGARRAYAAAGDCAKHYGLWRAAARCYRRGLELDLMDRELIDRGAKIASRIPVGHDWLAYVRAIDANPTWPHFGCRGAQVVIGDVGTLVTCPDVGAVLELLMSDADLIEVHPTGQFKEMPRAMALVILRRAMWMNPRDQASDPLSLRVVFSGRTAVRLDEQGDWTPVMS